MFKYIYRDMLSMIRFLPYGVFVGIPVAAICMFVMKRKGRKEPAATLPVLCFGFYLALILVITVFSREGGESNGVDLELFSTWGINDRNNAFVVENVLLFLPYGFFGGWVLGKKRRFIICTAMGAITSLCIECLQLVTGRGFFQIDDILTNILGTMIGYLSFKLLFGRRA